MPDRVLVFGNGWLGNKLAATLGGEISTADITNREAVMNALDDVHPAVVVNAAGKTGRPNVDSCESDPAGTLLVNVAGAIILAEECVSRGIFMAHLGSGCVYDGSGSGYKEVDPPNFFGSMYSRSKILSEQALKELPALQLRIRMPFDGEPHARNLITKLVKYPRVISVPNSLTYIPDFLKAAKHLIEARRIGLWNITNPGTVTHGQLLELYQRIVDPGHKVEIMTLEELSSITKAGRSNCVLDTEKIAGEGIQLQPVQAALVEALKRYREALT